MPEDEKKETKPENPEEKKAKHEDPAAPAQPSVEERVAKCEESLAMVMQKMTDIEKTIQDAVAGGQAPPGAPQAPGDMAMQNLQNPQMYAQMGKDMAEASKSAAEYAKHSKDMADAVKGMKESVGEIGEMFRAMHSAGIRRTIPSGSPGQTSEMEMVLRKQGNKI